MRKTKVDYQGGMIGAQRKLNYAAKKGLVFPFVPDEAEAYLDFLVELRTRVKVTRKRLESVILSDFPVAEIEYGRPDNHYEAKQMVIILKQAKRGVKATYEPEWAAGLLALVQELIEHENWLHEMLKEVN